MAYIFLLGLLIVERTASNKGVSPCGSSWYAATLRRSQRRRGIRMELLLSALPRLGSPHEDRGIGYPVRVADAAVVG